MSVRSSGRRAALGLAVAAGGALVVVVPAWAQDLGVGWEGRINDSSIVDGFEATGAVLRVPVTFEYTGPPGSVIADMTLELSPVDDGCDSRAYVQPLDVGDGDAGAGTPGSPEPPTTAPSGGESRTVESTWIFRVDPGCNGVYDLAVLATADPAGPAEPGDPGTQSAPLEVDGIRLSLAPPPPGAVDAVLAGDRTVTVRWTAPADWSGPGGPPKDALGYRVLRDVGDGAPVTVAETGADAASVIDDDLVEAPAGSYRYRVVALRAGASGAPIASEAVEDVVDLAAPPSATSTSPRPGAGGGSVGGRRVGGRVGQPAVAPPTTEFDPGFAPELDYGDSELGAPEAVPPADANLLEFTNEGPAGAGLLVPFAVALCLAVWAAHLRHLSRRAAPPI